MDELLDGKALRQQFTHKAIETRHRILYGTLWKREGRPAPRSFGEVGESSGLRKAGSMFGEFKIYQNPAPMAIGAGFVFRVP
jgi:hypothetical protein